MSAVPRRDADATAPAAAVHIGAPAPWETGSMHLVAGEPVAGDLGAAERLEAPALIEAIPPALPARSGEHEGLTELLALPEPEEAPPRRRRRGLRWGKTAVLAALVYVALFNVSVVRGSSMTPGIRDGDRIVVDRFAYLLGSVAHGDVVVLKYPLDPSLDYVKRVIGLPGDEVVIEDGRVFVNGVLLDEPYVESMDALSRTAVRVKPAHFFVLGDNRPRSSDSREFGQVPMDYVRGRVEARLWPLSRLGAVR